MLSLAKTNAIAARLPILAQGGNKTMLCYGKLISIKNGKNTTIFHPYSADWCKIKWATAGLATLKREKQNLKKNNNRVKCQ